MINKNTSKISRGCPSQSDVGSVATPLAPAFKICRKCSNKKELSFFRLKLDKNGKKYPYYWCIDCEKMDQSRYKKKYYAANREAIIKRTREYNIKHNDRKLEYLKSYYKSNIERHKERMKKHYTENRIDLISKACQWAKDNRWKVNCRNARYREDMPDWYVIGNLKAQGFDKDLINEDVINLNRLMIKIKRYGKDNCN